MEGSVNYAEYTVAQKAEGKNLQKRILMYALYAIVLIGIIALMAAIPGAALWGGILFVLVIALIFFTQRLVKEENKYEVVSAHLKIQRLNGAGKGKVLFEGLVSAFTLIAPVNDEYKAQFESADEVLECRGDKASVDSYFGLLEKDGKKTVVTFEATNAMLKVMKFYNSKGTVVTTVRR